MHLFEQLSFFFGPLLRPAKKIPAIDAQSSALDLQDFAREILIAAGAGQLATKVRVRWNTRMRSTAGRADYRQALVVLNPLLQAHEGEVERTLRHELAHLLAHARAGRRRIAPHGNEWRKACADLGLAGEKRCHNLPLPTRRRACPYLYICPQCSLEFPRTRRIRRALACLNCCRRFNRGRFASKFQLRLVRRTPPA